jgi:hypothetical protein
MTITKVEGFKEEEFKEKLKIQTFKPQIGQLGGIGTFKKNLGHM